MSDQRQLGLALPETEPFVPEWKKPEAHARRSDPITSKDAAASVNNIRDSQRFILAMFRLKGPMTDSKLAKEIQIAGIHRLSPSGIRTRRSELVSLGLLRDTGRTEQLESGRHSIVWEAVSKS